MTSVPSTRTPARKTTSTLNVSTDSAPTVTGTSKINCEYTAVFSSSCRTEGSTPLTVTLAPDGIVIADTEDFTSSIVTAAPFSSDSDPTVTIVSSFQLPFAPFMARAMAAESVSAKTSAFLCRDELKNAAENVTINTSNNAMMTLNLVLDDIFILHLKTMPYPKNKLILR